MRAIDVVKTSLELMLLLASLLLCLVFACWFVLSPNRPRRSRGGFALRLHRHQPG